MVLIEAALCTFACWTLAYHFALIFALPARLTVIPFLVFLITTMILFRRGWTRPVQRHHVDRWPALGLLATGLATGLFTLFVSRPNLDDFGFFSRAIGQLDRLDLPFLLVDRTLHINGLAPPLAKVHVLTSYEPLVALSAAILGVDALSLYQNVSGFVAALLLPFVYFLLYRHFRLSRSVALLATLTAIMFLLLDGNTLRSFGNFGLVRIWQGKVILVTVLLPATLLLAHRYLSYPTPRRFGSLAIVGICAVGLSSSGIFLFPMLVFAISLAYILAGGFSGRRLKRSLMVNVASFYGVAIAAGFATGIFKEATDLAIWNEPIFPKIWWENLALVFGDPTTVSRSLVILLVVPLGGLGRIGGRFFVFLSVTLSALFANPLLGPLWLNALGPVVYWRLAYLFPVPWCAGLLVSAVDRGKSRRRLFSPGNLVAISTVALLFVALQFTVLNPGGTLPAVSLKPALEYRFAPAEMAFVRSVSPRLDNKVVLAPFDIVSVLGLMNPSVSFEATRGTYMLYGFGGRGDPEFERRNMAQIYVSRCSPSARGAKALLQSIEQGVGAIIARTCNQSAHPSVAEIEKRMPAAWKVTETSSSYILLESVSAKPPDRRQPHD